MGLAAIIYGPVSKGLPQPPSPRLAHSHDRKSPQRHILIIASQACDLFHSHCLLFYAAYKGKINKPVSRRGKYLFDFKSDV